MVPGLSSSHRQAHQGIERVGSSPAKGLAWVSLCRYGNGMLGVGASSGQGPCRAVGCYSPSATRRLGNSFGFATQCQPVTFW